MGGGNGAKAAQKRARNDKKAPAKAASQLKANAAAMSIICNQCKQTFLSTSREPQLTLHAVNKHNATLPQCFPDYQPAAK
ncbi:At2g23090 like protein [Chaetomium sp. MPI-SDFR-AT-0129]|nr:At2g23090 like protein [Chaetomium sp. MPI-SDFR-AT-0129]